MSEINLETLTQLAKEIKEFNDVLKTAIRLSGKIDKRIYLEIGIDSAVFSRCLSNQANFPPQKILQLCDILGNDLVPIWFALQRGYDVTKSTSALEEKIKELEIQNKLLKDLVGKN